MSSVETAVITRSLSTEPRTIRTSRLLAAVLTLAVAAACGGSGGSTQANTALDALSSAAAVKADSDISVFHDQLVVNGENIQSEFGGALLTLDMNPRDLQQDTPDHAYHTVLERVRAVPDAQQRADLMRALFGTTNPR